MLLVEASNESGVLSCIMKFKRKLPDELIINTSKLELILSKYHDKLSARSNWSTPFSVFLSFLLCITVSDFKDVFGLKALQWELLIIVCLLSSFLWLALQLYKNFKESPFDVLISDIQENIKNVPEFTAIYFIKAKRDNIPKILVTRNMTWDCYFLPYVHYSPYESIHNQKEKHLKKTIAGYLGIKHKIIDIEHIVNHPLSSIKYSESERIRKQYNFEFFAFFSNNDDSNDIIEDEFSVGGRDFYWLTLDELELDKNTQEKNIDVIDHLRKNYNVFFNEIRDSIN